MAFKMSATFSKPGTDSTLHMEEITPCCPQCARLGIVSSGCVHIEADSAYYDAAPSGIEIRMWGTFVSPAHPLFDMFADPSVKPPWPIFILRDDATGATRFHVQLWREEATLPGNPLIVRREWRPDTGKRIGIPSGYESSLLRKRHHTDILRAVEFLRTINGPGRPQGSGGGV